MIINNYLPVIQRSLSIAINNIVIPLTNSQKRSLVIAAIATAIFTTCYIIFNRCFLNQFTVLFLPASTQHVIAFEKGLNDWVKREGSMATEAAIMIKNAFYKKLTFLSLANSKLKTLPPEIGQLSNLRRLYLCSNKMENIPPEIGQLSNLECLDFSNNKIKNIPPEIGRLSNLKDLWFFDNKMENIPPEIGELSELTYLSISNNSNLSTLPISLGQCSELTGISITLTSIPQSQVDAILAMCQARRLNEEALSVLPERLEAWKTFSKKKFDLSFIEELSKEKKIVINEWLTRLERTRDFRTSVQQGLAKAACGILQSLKTSPSFEEIFFAQVRSNLERCEDRAAMSFNEIYLAWQLDLLGKNQTMDEKSLLKIIAAAAKTIALRFQLQKRIDDQETKQRIEAEKRPKQGRRPLEENISRLNEGVEIFLYYEIHLRKSLGLLTFMQKSNYAQGIGKSSWIDEQALVNDVQACYIDEMIDLPSTLALREKSESFSKKWEPEHLKFTEEMDKLNKKWEQLSEQTENENIEEKKIAIEKDMKEIAKNRKKMEREFTRQWIKEMEKSVLQ